VKELLDSLGTLSSSGKAAHSSSQPDTGIQSYRFGSTSFKGMAALSGDSEARSLEAPSHSAVAQSRQVAPPRPVSTAGSVSLSPLLANGLCDSEEQPSSPPLSQLKVVTVVPQPPYTDIVTVAQSVLVGQPHPPPSLHHLPLSPTPSPALSMQDEAVKLQVSSCSLPAMKPSSVPAPMTTQTPSTQQAGPLCVSAPMLVKKTDGDQRIYSLSLDSLAAHPPSTNDFISYPSAIPQDNVLLFGHSADHINFFSAREKFKGMSQDGKTLSAAVQQSSVLKSCGKEHQPLPPDVLTSEEEKRKVNSVCINFPNLFFHIKQQHTSINFGQYKISSQASFVLRSQFVCIKRCFDLFLGLAFARGPDKFNIDY